MTERGLRVIAVALAARHMVAPARPRGNRRAQVARAGRARRAAPARTPRSRSHPAEKLSIRVAMITGDHPQQLRPSRVR